MLLMTRLHTLNMHEQRIKEGDFEELTGVGKNVGDEMMDNMRGVNTLKDKLSVL